MLERLFPSVGRKDIFPMKRVATQGTRNYDQKIIKKQIWGFWNFYVFCAQKYVFIMTN